MHLRLISLASDICAYSHCLASHGSLVLTIKLTSQDCVICREQLDPADSKPLPCIHGSLFHAWCIDKWTAKQKESNSEELTCPMCRQPIPWQVSASQTPSGIQEEDNEALDSPSGVIDLRGDEDEVYNESVEP